MFLKVIFSFTAWFINILAAINIFIFAMLIIIAIKKKNSSKIFITNLILYIIIYVFELYLCYLFKGTAMLLLLALVQYGVGKLIGFNHHK